MTSNWSTAVQMVTRFFPAGSKPKEEEIGKMLQFAARHLGLDDKGDEFQKAYRILREKLTAKISEGVTLTDTDTAWTAWLDDMKQSSKWDTPRWNSYCQYLQEKRGADWTQLQPLDKSSDTILGQLSDPRQDSPSVRRKGLILGDVQSGKTRTYLAVMNKAVDCGYKLLIVLTSSDENLRRQTQDRIDSDFVGYMGPRKRVGLGKFIPAKYDCKPFSLTNDENDFVKAQSTTLEPLPRPSWNDARPIVAVMKKNSSVLDKFNKWLDNPEFSKDLPVLIIDDESDYASINSAKTDDSPTKINALLRKLCSISARTSYVAVTATPFANIFIDDEIEDDLFPKDFIHILPTPYAYIGAKKIFGDLDSLPIQSSCVKELDEEMLDDWLPVSHKKDFQFSTNELQQQVKYAINCFFVACALRPNSRNKRQSMLIHMSRFTAVQQQIADMTFEYVGDLVLALKFHRNTDDSRVAALHDAYQHEYAHNNQTYGLSWKETLRNICLLTERIQVRLVNSKATEWNAAHQVPIDLFPNECSIFIGGNQISRGMTLDGLLCSIFYRKVTASDTLLQMGRWFGYRQGYEQLQRIWLLEQSKLDYRYSCSIVEELKTSAIRMKHRDMTPRQFGISIKKNPNKGVRITNSGKMRNATETNGPFAEFDLADEIIESIRLSASNEQMNDNDSALKSLLENLTTNKNITQGTSNNAQTHIFQNVPVSAILNFLSQYRAGYNDKYFGPTLMQYKDHEPIEMKTTMASEYARTQKSEHPNITWNVAFINGAKSGTQIPDTKFHWTEIERKSSYEKDYNLFAINGTKMRLADKSDVLKVADYVSPIHIVNEGQSERKYYLTKYFGDSPTLMLYRVRIKPDNKKYESYVPKLGHGLLAAKIIIPTDEFIDSGDRGKAVYYYNTVATRQQYDKLRRQIDEDDEE